MFCVFGVFIDRVVSYVFVGFCLWFGVVLVCWLVLLVCGGVGDVFLWLLVLWGCFVLSV